MNIDNLSKRVISFDVGIKNMAYCIFTVDSNILDIIEWKTINLMNDEDTIKKTDYLCTCENQTKRNGTYKICCKKATYKKNIGDDKTIPIQYYCEKHAKSNKSFVIPQKKYNSTSLNKLKIEELIELCQLHFLSIENVKKTKTNLFTLLNNFFKERSLEPIIHKKQKNANETDIISICRNMRRELDKIQDFQLITDVIIENQISTIAARMNTIQGMLVQYFIMKSECNNSINIEFISSSNKLKGLPIIPIENKNILMNNLNSEMNIKPKINKYKENKKDGQYHCRNFLYNNSQLSDWKYVLNTSKVDDYADCFLQGIWFIKNKGFFKENTDYRLHKEEYLHI